MSLPDLELQLSPHFNLEEFRCHDGVAVPPHAVRALKGLCVRFLEPLRARFGPVMVMSGYRHRRYNAAIGGAGRSHHVYDWWLSSPAADVACETGEPEEWAAFLRKLGARGVGTYDTHVHVDARRSPAYWTG
jgi:uncharacterized protein YcbK (DUF882 family)